MYDEKKDRTLIMKITSFLCIALFFFSSIVFAEEYEDTYCGTITKVKQLGKNEALVFFTEMDDYEDEYQRQLPKKNVKFSVTSDGLSRNEYKDLLTSLKQAINRSGMCIGVSKKSKRIISVTAGG